MRQLIIDTETTGLDPKLGHRVIEFAALELVDRRPTGRNLHLRFDPEREIDAGATEVHGKTWDDLKALTDSEDDFGAPLMTPGFVDHVEMLVLGLNRRVPAVPFSLRPSGRTATH